jgi:hypothetical protein
MSSSNTRIFKRGDGDELWRRSLYTYWKRACPPPSLMTFDAPTRESCTIRRATTNTPLQALVLWNDEQYVEAARVLAARTLRESMEPAGRLAGIEGREPANLLVKAEPAAARPEQDAQRLIQMFRRCTGRAPDKAELQRMSEALKTFRDRYRQKPEDAEKLLKTGVAPLPKDISAPELAAWTMIANALMNLSATITQS